MKKSQKLKAGSEHGGLRRLGKALYVSFLSASIVPLFEMRASAAGEDIWTKASSIMQDVYGKIMGISTVAAIVTASVALLLMNFSKNGKTVDESRAWLKRIVITWAVLNSMGFIMAYVTPLFSGGQWSAGT